MAAKIHTLIEKPFGPYPQYHILADKWRPSSTKIPTLTDVFLYANDRVIGLDDTEVLYPLPASVPHPAKSDIQWYGVLTVDKLEWLSDQGRAWLEADLQKRDIDLHINKASSGLTLDALYGNKKDEGLKIRVYLQGEKHASITYFVDNVHPTKMILTSRVPVTRPTDAIQRRYIVESLDIDMMPTSRNFLARYQLLASMEHIVSTDPSPPPRALRDIEYWISGYLRCRPAIEQHRRYIFAPPDDDADDRDDDPNLDPNPGEPTTPRYLRHLHRCTVAGMFAAQAEWMLAQQLGPQPERRIVDLGVWYAFCAEVRHIRSKVPESGGWGRPYGYKEKDGDNGKTLKEFIQKKFFVPDSRIKRLENAQKKSRTLPTRTPTPEPEPEPEDTRPSPLVLQHHYDSDFTDNLPSSSEASDPDSTSITSIPMADLASVPAFCFTRPFLLAGTFLWKCPGHGCDFRLDLMHPDKSSATIDPRHIAWLKNPRSWRNTAEPRLRERFDAIVSAHYLRHIREVDLDYDIVFEAQGITFSRKRAPTPERTSPPPPPRKKIKVEEVEPTTHYPRLSRSRQSSNRPTPGASRVFIR